MRKVLDLDAILNSDPGEIERLEIPEWDGTVFLRVLNGKERDALEHGLTVDPKTGRPRQTNFRAWLCSLVLCDESGTRLFKQQHIPQLAEKDGRALERIVEKALKMNKITDEDVEAMVGNSSSGQVEDFGSDLPLSSDAPSEKPSKE